MVKKQVHSIIRSKLNLSAEASSSQGDAPYGEAEQSKSPSRVLKMLYTMSFWQKYKFEVVFGAIALSIVGLDQLLKYIVLFSNPSINLNLLTIHLVQNTGAGFGILKNQTLLLGIISLCVALAVLFNYKKIQKEHLPQVLWGIFLGGVIGNLIDRLFRKVVIDFIDFGFWPAFNAADAAITISVIGLVIWYWRKG